MKTWVLGSLMFAFGIHVAGAEVPACTDTSLRPAPDQAMIVVFRAPTMKGAVWSHHYFVDGVRRLELRTRQYGAVLVAPGRHTLATNVSTAIVGRAEEVIDAKPGETYFFEDHVGFNRYKADFFLPINRGMAEASVADKKYVCRDPSDESAGTAPPQ